jgi:hypothetical protein
MSAKSHCPQPYGVTASNKDFIREIKANHFDTKDGFARSASALNYHYQTNNMATYCFKGNASAIAAKLEASKKDDLRRNHFEVGGTTANVLESTVNKQFRPLTAQQRGESKPALNRGLLNELCKSHWSTEPSKA